MPTIYSVPLFHIDDDDALDTVVVDAAAVFLLFFLVFVSISMVNCCLLAFWSLRNIYSVRSHNVLLAAEHSIQFGKYVERRKDIKKRQTLGLLVNESNVWLCDALI